jgi:hypothetical protein
MKDLEGVKRRHRIRSVKRAWFFGKDGGETGAGLVEESNVRGR